MLGENSDILKYFDEIHHHKENLRAKGSLMILQPIIK
jgi:hypothetical protein